MSERPVEVDYPAPGIRVEMLDEMSPVRLRVRTATEMPEWVPYVTDVTREDSRRVATTLEYRGTLYAIAGCKRRPVGWEYELVLWPRGEMVRRTVHLSREGFQAAAEDKQAERRVRRYSRFLNAAGFFIAFLPHSLQDRLGQIYEYDGVAWTAISSAVVGVASLFLTAWIHIVQRFAGGFGGAGGMPPALEGALAILAPYLVVDSLFRYATAMFEDEPVGLLPLEILDRVVRSVRGLKAKPAGSDLRPAGVPLTPNEVGESPPQRAVPAPAPVKAGTKTTEAPLSPKPSSAGELIPGLRVSVFPLGSRYSAAVHAHRQMADWVCYNPDVLVTSGPVATTIVYCGEYYAIASAEPVTGGWVYSLVPWPDGEMARKVFDLSPEAHERREQERIAQEKQQRRDKIADALGILIAFLPASVQERVSERYDYDAPRWTAFNSLGVGLVSLIALLSYYLGAVLTAVGGMSAAAAGGTSARSAAAGKSWEEIVMMTIVPFLIIESIARFGTAVIGRKPLGLFILELPHVLARAAWRVTRRVIRP